MTESGLIVVAIIGAMQAIIIALLGIMSKKAKSTAQITETTAKDAKETHEQIVNHHASTPNYRVESDSRHTEVIDWLSNLSDKIDSQSVRVSRNTRRLNNLETRVKNELESHDVAR